MSLPLPIPGADPDTWGPKLNAYLQDLDSRVGGAGVPGAQVVTGPFATTSGSYGPADRTVKTTYTNGPNRRLVLVHYGYANLGPATVDMVAHTVIGGINKTIVIDTVPAGDTSTVATHVTRVGMFPVDPHGTYGFEGTGTVNGDQPSVVSWIEVDSPADLSVDGPNPTVTRLGVVPPLSAGQEVLMAGVNQPWQRIVFNGDLDTPYPNGYAGPNSSLAQGFTGLNNIGLQLVAGNHPGFVPLSTWAKDDLYPRLGFNLESIEFSNGAYPPCAVQELFINGTMSFTMLAQTDTSVNGAKRIPGSRFAIIQAHQGWDQDLSVAFPAPNSAPPIWSFVNLRNELNANQSTTPDAASSGFRIDGLVDVANVGAADPLGTGLGSGASKGNAPGSVLNRSGDKIQLFGDLTAGRSAIGYAKGTGALIGNPVGEGLFLTDADPDFATRPAAGVTLKGIGLLPTQMVLPPASPRGTPGTPSSPATVTDLFVNASGNLCWRDRSGLIHVLGEQGVVAAGLPGIRTRTVTITPALQAVGANVFSSPNFDDPNLQTALRTNDGDTTYLEITPGATFASDRSQFDTAVVPLGGTLSAQRIYFVMKQRSNLSNTNVLQFQINGGPTFRLVPYSGINYATYVAEVPLATPLSGALLAMTTAGLPPTSPSDPVRITQVYAELDYSVPATS
jgi:hypothetical protein